MSREIAGTASEDGAAVPAGAAGPTGPKRAAGEGRPSGSPRRPVVPQPPRRTFASRMVTRAAALGLAVALAGAALAGRYEGRGPGLIVGLESVPGAHLEDSADLDRLPLILVITNPGNSVRAVDDVEVTGLGPVPDARVPAGTRIAAGASVQIPITVAADCALVEGDRPAVAVDGVNAGIPTGDPRALLAAMCPPAEPGPAVDVVAARTDGMGGFAVRLVNHGGVTATVVAPGGAAHAATLLTSPTLPLTLVPGAASTVRVRVTPPGCPGPAGAGTAPGTSAAPPPLQAGTPRGVVPVGRWPAALVRAAAASADRGCAVG